MATYMELFALRADSDLQDKIAVAVAIAAYAKLSGTPSADEAAWAKNAIADPGSMSRVVINAVLAANKTESVATIQGASDAVIQTTVDAVIDGLVLGG